MYLFAYTRTQRKDVLSDNVVVFVDVIPYIPVDKSAVQTADKRADHCVRTCIEYMAGTTLRSDRSAYRVRCPWSWSVQTQVGTLECTVAIEDTSGDA